MSIREPGRSQAETLEEAPTEWSVQLFLAWGIFNPNGPTLQTVGIRENPKEARGEVFLTTLHFTGEGTRILGSIDLTRADATAAFASILKEAFEASDPAPVVPTIPSFVVSILPDEPPNLAQALFRAVPTLREADWGQELDLLRRYGPQLFDRAGEELSGAIQTLRQEAANPDYLELLELRFQRVLENAQAKPERAAFAPFSEDAFDEWWAVMESEDYLRTALFQFAQAWVGARHVARHALPETLAFEVARDFMAGARLPLWPRDLNSAVLAEVLGLAEEPQVGTTSAPTFDVEAMFPLSDVANYLAGQGLRLDYQRDGISWRPRPEVMADFTITPLQFTAEDGFSVTEQADLTLRAPWAAESDDETLDQWNQFVAVAGFARDPRSGEVILTSKVGIHDGDDAAAARVYAPIMALAASGFGWVAERFARSDFSVSPKHCPYAGEEDDPPIDPMEFTQALKETVESRGLVGTLGPGALTFEVPWDDGALTKMAGIPSFRDRLKGLLGLDDRSAQDLAGRTSLVQIRTDTRHPWFGRGVECTVELPLSPDDPGVLELVRDLNTWELETPDLPPYFGAWIVGPRAPMFKTFVPNQLCPPGLVRNLAAWSAVRAGKVRQWLRVEGVPS